MHEATTLLKSLAIPLRLAAVGVLLGVYLRQRGRWAWMRVQLQVQIIRLRIERRLRYLRLYVLYHLWWWSMRQLLDARLPGGLPKTRTKTQHQICRNNP
jgi:hypothetical protein